MVTNQQILRARPQGGSPLGRLVKGEISHQQFEREVQQKWAREERLREAVTRPVPPPGPR